MTPEGLKRYTTRELYPCWYEAVLDYFERQLTRHIDNIIDSNAGDEDMGTVRRKFRPFAIWHSCETIASRQAMNVPRSIKKITVLP